MRIGALAIISFRAPMSRRPMAEKTRRMKREDGAAMTRPRMLTGDRPTGKLHLGHYVGTLKNRITYQQRYESFFIIADVHMLTTKHLPEHIRETDAHARDLVLDAIAAGIDPEHATFYLQSGIHEIHEIETLFQNLVTVSRLERIPSLKDMARDASIEMPYGLLGYPVLQAADILCVKAHVVPVGNVVRRITFRILTHKASCISVVKRRKQHALRWKQHTLTQFFSLPFMHVFPSFVFVPRWRKRSFSR